MKSFAKALPKNERKREREGKMYKKIKTKTKEVKEVKEVETSRIKSTIECGNCNYVFGTVNVIRLQC